MKVQGHLLSWNTAKEKGPGAMVWWCGHRIGNRPGVLFWYCLTPVEIVWLKSHYSFTPQITLSVINKYGLPTGVRGNENLDQIGFGAYFFGSVRAIQSPISSDGY